MNTKEDLQKKYQWSWMNSKQNYRRQKMTSDITKTLQQSSKNHKTPTQKYKKDIKNIEKR